jgi:hypothetical protein
MKLKIAIGAGLAALGIASISAAQAQGIYIGRPRIYMPPMVDQSVVPPSEILMLVRAAGLSPLTQPARRGHRYVVLASDRMGGQLRVVMNAYDGRILNVRPAHDPRFAYQPDRPPAGVPERAPPQRYSAVPAPGLKDPPAAAPSSRSAPSPAAAHPVPTSRIPLAGERRQASAPTASDPAPTPRSARTPLPRPRPAARSESQTAAAPAEPPAATHSAPPAARAQEPAQQPTASPAPTTGQSQPGAVPPKDVQLVPVAPLE